MHRLLEAEDFVLLNERGLHLHVEGMTTVVHSAVHILRHGTADTVLLRDLHRDPTGRIHMLWTIGGGAPLRRPEMLEETTIAPQVADLLQHLAALHLLHSILAEPVSWRKIAHQDHHHKSLVLLHILSGVARLLHLDTVTHLLPRLLVQRHHSAMAMSVPAEHHQQDHQQGDPFHPTCPQQLLEAPATLFFLLHLALEAVASAADSAAHHHYTTHLETTKQAHHPHLAAPRCNFRIPPIAPHLQVQLQPVLALLQVRQAAALPAHHQTSGAPTPALRRPTPAHSASVNTSPTCRRLCLEA